MEIIGCVNRQQRFFFYFLSIRDRNAEQHSHENLQISAEQHWLPEMLCWKEALAAGLSLVWTLPRYPKTTWLLKWCVCFQFSRADAHKYSACWKCILKMKLPVNSTVNKAGSCTHCGAVSFNSLTITAIRHSLLFLPVSFHMGFSAEFSCRSPMRC